MSYFYLTAVPLAIALLFFVIYLFSRNNKHIRSFYSFLSSGIMVIYGLYILNKYGLNIFYDLKTEHLAWLGSGFIMVMMVGIKVKIFIDIYKRSKNPDKYHFNYFGKKVYNASVTKPKEVGIFVITIPLFLFSGSYFIAKLINIILSGKLSF